MVARPDPTLISVEVFARLVGSTVGELAGLLRSGVIRRAAPGKIALVQGIRAYVEHVKASARSASAASAMADAKAARAEASELSLAVQNRELLPDADADAALLHICGAILETLSGLPARVSRDRADRVAIEDSLRAALTQIADDLVTLATFDPRTG